MDDEINDLQVMLVEVNTVQKEMTICKKDDRCQIKTVGSLLQANE